MLHVSRWRYILVALATVAAILFALPSLLPEQTRATLPAFLPNKAVNLGLDLRGGSYLLYEVDLRALQRERLETETDNMARALNEAKPRIGYTGRGVSGDAARLKVLNVADQDRALAVIRKLHEPSVAALGGGPSDPAFTVSESSDGYIEARMTRTGLEKQATDAVTRSMEVVGRRIDELGTSEISIQRQGADRINIQAPGMSDPDALKARIGQTAKMTFHLHDASVSAADLAAGRAPPGSTIMPQDDASEPFVAIRSRAVLSGDDLTDAQPSFDPQSQNPVVSFRFNQRGTRIFCQITTENVNRRFAVVLDGKVLTAPNILGPICGGNGQIFGNFTVESATELSTLLRAGALPAPLRVVEQRTVGAELGQDAIEAGQISTALAFVLVLTFMILAYGFLFGGISVIGIIINGVMVLAAMSATGAALTLPGVAGLILTLAVALDANVLIYERIRDEVKAGRSPAMAIDAGFNRAMVTIFDANLTHFFAATIMLILAPSGPVKGFAWTLTIGVFTSVFTAVLVTQVLLGWWFRSTRPKKLPIT